MSAEIQTLNQPQLGTATAPSIGNDIVNVAKFGIEAYIAYLLIVLVLTVVIVIIICIIMLFNKAEKFKSTRSDYHLS
jgi:hypothetical protein